MNEIEKNRCSVKSIDLWINYCLDYETVSFKFMFDGKTYKVPELLAYLGHLVVGQYINSCSIDVPCSYKLMKFWTELHTRNKYEAIEWLKEKYNF